MDIEYQLGIVVEKPPIKTAQRRTGLLFIIIVIFPVQSVQIQQTTSHQKKKIKSDEPKLIIKKEKLAEWVYEKETYLERGKWDQTQM